MQLEDLLDELSERVDAARGRTGRPGTSRSGRTGRGRATSAGTGGAVVTGRRVAAAARGSGAEAPPQVRRGARTLALWGGGAWLVAFGGLAAALGFGNPLEASSLDLVAAVVSGAVAVPAVPVVGWAARTRRRDDAARRAAATSREIRDEVAALPADVRAEWRRMRRARALVADLAADGLVAGTATFQLDATIAELHRLLAADRRSSELGGTTAPRLAQQVGELADLLVALADEAVAHRVDGVGAEVPATLQEAHDRLRALREAREEVDRADAGIRDDLTTAPPPPRPVRDPGAADREAPAPERRSDPRQRPDPALRPDPAHRPDPGRRAEPGE